LQFEANTLILKNTKNNLDIIKYWKEKNVENNYYNVNPSKEKCCDLFGLHVWDQPVLSCILKKNGFKGVPDEASWYLPSQSIYSSMEKNINSYPLFTARNPFSYSLIGRCVKYKEHLLCKHNDINCPEMIKTR
jgi:hypothetical protein